MLLFIIVSNKSSKEDHFIGEWRSEELLLKNTYDEDFDLMYLQLKRMALVFYILKGDRFIP